MLGEAGISSNDSLVIAGECLPCGGGPSPAIFTYWLLKYLGHENNTSTKSATRQKANYVPINKSIKPHADLQKVFAGLQKDRPVVVYTNIGVEASLVWFALNLSGYDARLYSWRDWLENQPRFNCHNGILPGGTGKSRGELVI